MIHYLLTVKEFSVQEPYSVILIASTQEDIDYLVDMHVTHDEHDNVESYSINEITERQSTLMQEENIDLYGSRCISQLNKDYIYNN